MILPASGGTNVGIMPKESRVVSEDENDNNETMTEGEEGDDEGV